MKNSLFFLASVILLLGIIAPASADITLNFVDRSFFGDNPITITNQNGTEVFNGTTSSKTIVLNDSQAYWLSFEPGGITDIARNPDYGALEGLGFVTKFGIAIFLVIMVGVVWFWRSKH